MLKSPRVTFVHIALISNKDNEQYQWNGESHLLLIVSEHHKLLKQTSILDWVLIP